MASFFLPLLTTALGALGGGLANREKVNKQESTTNTNSSTSTAPAYDAKAQSVRDTLLNELLFRTESTPDFESKYTAQGLASINKTRDSSRAAIDNILASRGLSGSPIAASAQVGQAINTGNQQASFLNNIPLMIDSMKRERLGDLSSFFSSLPVGQTSNTTGTQTTKGTSTTPGNVAAGALGGGGSALGLLYGMGAFGKKPNTGVGGY